MLRAIITRLLLLVAMVWTAATVNFIVPRLTERDPIAERLMQIAAQGGGTLAGLTGYRAMPSLAAAVVLGLYWLAAWTWLKPRAQVQLAARPA